MPKDFYSDNHSIQAGSPDSGVGNLELKAEGEASLVGGSSQSFKGYVTAKGDGSIYIEPGKGEDEGVYGTTTARGERFRVGLGSGSLPALETELDVYGSLKQYTQNGNTIFNTTNGSITLSAPTTTIDSDITLTKTVSNVELPSNQTKSINYMFTGNTGLDGFVYYTGTAPTWSSASIVHSYSGQRVLMNSGWDFTDGSGNVGHFVFEIPSGGQITDIELLIGNDGSDTVLWNVNIYRLSNISDTYVVSDNFDSGLAWIGEVSGVTPTDVESTSNSPGTVLSLATDSGWEDFSAESDKKLYLAISAETYSGSPSTDAFKLYGIRIFFSWKNMTEIGW